MASNFFVTQDTNPFFEKSAQPAPPNNKVVNILQGVVIVAFIIIILYLFVLTPNQVDGESMMPNFEDKQVLLTNRIPQWVSGTALGGILGIDYQRGDVVVVDKPNLNNLIIKRVIAVPGDEIAINNGAFFINGTRLTESYIAPEVITRGSSFLMTGESKIVPAGHYFVAGDNRGNSLDSRATPVGFVANSELQGKVFLRFWPLPSLSFIGQGETTLQSR